jgi:hypothetical protein
LVGLGDGLGLSTLVLDELDVGVETAGDSDETSRTRADKNAGEGAGVGVPA